MRFSVIHYVFCGGTPGCHSFRTKVFFQTLPPPITVVVVIFLPGAANLFRAFVSYVGYPHLMCGKKFLESIQILVWEAPGCQLSR